MPQRLLLAAALLLSYAVHAVPETPVKIIPLAPPLNSPDAEISGLTWCGDTLILMPQYPMRLSNTDTPYFYTLQKHDVIAALESDDTPTLVPKPLKLIEQNLRKEIAIFDGYEAIACHGSEVWLTIEAVNLFNIYYAYLVRGSIDWTAETPELTIEPASLKSLASQSELRNMGDEALLVAGDKVISLHEVNDPRVVEQAAAHVFDSSTGKQSKIRFPHLPYRITDSTDLDSRNRFWVINYKYSGDKFSRKARDPLVEQYGEGESHKQYYNVERLIEFEVTESAVVRVDQAPLQLKMEAVEGRNWEGLVRLNDIGFLVASDKHPHTLFGFVPNQQVQAGSD